MVKSARAIVGRLEILLLQPEKKQPAARYQWKWADNYYCVSVYISIIIEPAISKTL